MPLLPLALGWLLLAAEPAPALPHPTPPSGSATDLRDLVRLGPRNRAKPSNGETEPAEYVVESAARATLVFLLPPGPRTVRALEFRPDEATAGAWREARLRLTWEDDDPDPTRAAVDLPIGLATGRVEGFTPAESVAVGTAGRSWVIRFPMPYRTGALLRIDTERPIHGRIVVRSTRGAADDAGYFHAAALATGSLATRSGRETVGESGRGRLVGVFLVTAGGEGASRSRHPGRIVVDGRPRGPLVEALGLGSPGGREAAGRPTSGAVLGSLDAKAAAVGGSGKTAGYRWFLADPVDFERSFAVEPVGGVKREHGVNGTAGAVAAFFWYSERPAPGRGGR